MIERLNTYEKSILAGALAMAAGTCLPIVSMPVVGSINYLRGGRGDGMIILVLSGAIMAAVIYGYHRMAAVAGVTALAIMFTTLVRFLEALSKVQGEAAKLARDNPFGELAVIVARSVGLEWGWIPLIGGAIAVVAAGLLAWRNSKVSSEAAEKIDDNPVGRKQTGGDGPSRFHSRLAQEPNDGLRNADETEAARPKPIARPIAHAPPLPGTLGKRRGS